MVRLSFADMTIHVFRQESVGISCGGAGGWVRDFGWQWLAFLLWFSINRHSATNKWNWCHVRSGRVALWGRKREQWKRLVYLHSAAEQMERLSSICMRQAVASLSPWPLLWDCDLRLNGREWDQSELWCWGFIPGLGKVVEPSWLQYSRLWLRLWRNASLFCNTCLLTCNSCQ